MLHHMLRAAAQRAFSTLDPYFKYVTMLLHGDGSALGSDTVTPFNSDASTNNFNITINGDARSNNFNPYQAGYYSNYFSSNSGLTAPNNSAFKPATNDFTVEAWIFSTSTGQQIVYGDSDSATNNGVLDLYLTSSGFLASDYWTSSTAVTTRTSTLAPTINQWNHVLVSRTGTTMYIGLNGVLQSFTAPSSYQSPATIYPTVGRLGAYAAGVGFIGYISNFRFINGTNLYSGSTYTVPTAPLTAVTNTSLLTCQSNRFIDNSTNNFTLTVNGTPQVAPAQPFTLPSSVATYGSGYFDGSGDYFSVASQTALGMGAGDFTYEAWIYVNEIVPTNALRGLYDSRVSGATGCGIYTSADTGTTSKLVYTTNSAIAASSTNTIKPYCWTYVAVTRSSGTVRGFLNGVLEFTVTDSRTFSSSAATYIGTDVSPQYFNGYITDARILKGTAQYTSAFTPPTSPLTAITNTSLLTTQFNGAGNNNGFKDSSQNNFTITRNGNTTQGTFTPYGSNWSMYSGTSGQYLSVPNSTPLNLTGGSYTIEMWINPTGNYGNYNTLIAKRIPGGGAVAWEIALYVTTGYLLFYNGTVYSSSTAPTANQWNHVAAVYDGTNINLYMNGTRILQSATTNSDASTSITIANFDNAEPYYGYMSNVRVTKGAALYTGTTYTVPTQPLTTTVSAGTVSLLTCQSNRFIDTSVNAATVTVTGSPSVQRFSPFAPLTVYNPATNGGSAYFDGSGDYLDAPSNAAFGYGTGNFTIEFWAYFTTISGSTPNLIDQRAGTAAQVVPTLYLNAGVFSYYVSGSNRFTGPTLVANRWYHLVVCRNSGTTTFYINGVSVGTYADSNNYIASPVRVFGSNDGGALNAQAGYCSNLRIVKGTAVYTSAFTPPTAPLTAISGTSLLLSYTNAGILDNAMMNDLETVGNAQISTSVKKYGTGSMYFDGSGDYLDSTGNTVNALGSGDWTIEFWVYFNSLSGTNIIDYRSASVLSNTLAVNYSSGMQLYVNNSTTAIQGSALSTATWYHIAVCKSGSSTKMFVNGTQAGSTYTDTNNYVAGANRPRIGSGGDAAGNYFNGYIDDLRITKGVARYTTTFTPPTAAFPNN